MSLFLIWVGLVLAGILGYLFFLWKRRKHRSRFQARLTILFLLFIIIPTVPLTLFMANLLTESADLLLVPGIGDALETSLGALRLLSEERACMFFRQFPDHNQWSPGLMQSYQIHFLASYRIREDSVTVLRDMRLANCPIPDRWTPDIQQLQSALREKQVSRLVPSGSDELVVLCQNSGDSVVRTAAYSMNSDILAAKGTIQRAHSTYSSLTLIKESIIQRNLIWGIAVLWVGGLSILAVLLSRTLSRGISEPIRALVDGMNRVAEGDLSARVETNAKDEIRFLVDSYNRMIEDLETSRKKLVQAERMAAWQEVARRISHEIKNSLTPISVSLHRFRSHYSDQPVPRKIEESLKVLEEEFASLSSLAAEFSEFARMPQPKKKPLDLNEIIQGMILLFQPMARGIKFRTELDPGLPGIEADREQMKRIFNNLIRNALDASAEGGTISLITRTSSQGGYRVQVEVIDQGKGMDRETLERAFLPHFTTKTRGSGLGLSIVQKIIDDHGGEIHIASKERQGTRVTIRL